jgi:hypothetical protein
MLFCPPLFCFDMLVFKVLTLTELIAKLDDSVQRHLQVGEIEPQLEPPQKVARKVDCVLGAFDPLFFVCLFFV